MNFLVAFKVTFNLTLIYSMSFSVYHFPSIKLQGYLLTGQNVNLKKKKNPTQKQLLKSTVYPFLPLFFLFTQFLLSSSTQAAITQHHRLDNLNSRHFFLVVLDSKIERLR